MRTVLIGAAIVIISMLCGILLYGCQPSFASREWSSGYDADWQAVCECWGETPLRPLVEVRDDCVGPVPQYWEEYGREQYGRQTGRLVSVCPDLAALRHEMSHYVYEYTGQSVAKCWL